MSTPLSPAFADVLRACREETNARFALMRREFPDLESDPFFEFLRSCGDPVVRAVEAVVPGAAVETGRAVCDAGLELVARHCAGPKARHRSVDDAWQRVLTAAARCVAANPRRVIGAVSNAVHQLASTREARPAQWIDLMEAGSSLATDPESLLRAGQVAAWRSGLAHYRDGALATAASLPSPLALAALGAQGDAAALLARMREDRWFSPEHPQDGPRLVARAGAFRGFGGPFLAPPAITLRHGQWLASSGEEHWIITADAFGATFHRAPGQVVPPPLPTDPSAVARLEVPSDCGEVTSLATHGSTTALTASQTHAVLFFSTAA